MPEYWNHNVAHHDKVITVAKQQGGSILDIGCGDGYLLERLAPHAHRLVGIDPDPQAITQSRRRLANIPRAQVICGSLLDPGILRNESFDVICCVAALHHMPLTESLHRIRELIAPSGHVIIVGIAADTSPADRLIAITQLVPAKIVGKLRHEHEPQVRRAEARTSLSDIKRVSATVMPGAIVRRRLYYRYTLTWTAPPTP